MSFLLKSSRLAASLVRFSHQGKFSSRKKKIILSLWQSHLEINKIFSRSCALACQVSAVPSKSINSKETLYEKSVSQVCYDIKSKGYIFREDLNDVWQSLKFSTTFTTEQTVVLISSCGHKLPQESTAEKLKLVKEIWDDFDNIGIKKTIYHYNALLKVYIELEHSFSPKEFLCNLKKQGIVPNLNTYRNLLQALSIQGNTASSKDLLEEMKMHSMYIDEGVFNSLILGYSLQGDFISAHGILELMEKKELMLSSKSYTNLVLGYAKQGNIEKVKEIVNECKKKAMTLSTAQLLEIAYTFAANRHSEHFSATLDMITLSKNFPFASTTVIHRLLHKNLDKEALELFELPNKLGSIALVQEPLQMFLDHYVRFRKPNEVLNIVHIFKEKGWSPIALAYCIKETLIRKDIFHCLNFLNTMKKRGYPLRVHYFYPILIKTRPLGNEKVLKIIRLIGAHDLIFSREAMKAFHNFYDFLPGAELDDLEKLKDAGMNEKLVAWKILDILLHRKNINGAINLVSKYGISYPSVVLPISMAVAFENDHENFVNILYYLIHNLKANKIIRGLNPHIDPIEYEQFIIELAKARDKTFNLRVLEEMLKKTITLTPNAADFVFKKFPCPEVSNLVSKLTSADLNLTFDENLLNRLLQAGPPETQRVLGNEEREKSWSELNEALNRNENVADVMRIFEHLARQAGFSAAKKHEDIVKRLFGYVSLKGDVANTERVYEFGVRKNIFSADSYSPCIMAHLKRKNLDGAVKRYYEGLKTTKKSKALELIIREIKKKNNNMALNDLKLSMRKVYGEYVAAVELLDKFAKLGYPNEMRIIFLNNSKTDRMEPLFKELCRKMLKERNWKYIETLEKASRNIPGLNLTPVYDQLLNLHALGGNLKKILKLYVEMERDDAMKEQFRKLFFNVLKNWRGDIETEELEKVLQCVLEDCEQRKPLKDAETVSDEENIHNVSKERVHPSFGSKNELISNFNNDDLILKCFCVIQAGKPDEYFKILRTEIDRNSAEKVRNYFFCYKLIPHLMKNQKYLDEYEDLANKLSLPIYWKKYFKLCIRLKNTKGINKAMKKLGTHQLKFCLQEVSFEDCLGVIENEECDEKLGKNLSLFYLKIINQCFQENQFAMAKKYYEKAKKRRLEYFFSSF